MPLSKAVRMDGQTDCCRGRMRRYDLSPTSYYKRSINCHQHKPDAFPHLVFVYPVTEKKRDDAYIHTLFKTYLHRQEGSFIFRFMISKFKYNLHLILSCLDILF